MPPQDDTLSSLERARERLYSPNRAAGAHEELHPSAGHDVRHDWGDTPKLEPPSSRGGRHVRLAALFFGGAAAFFIIAAGIAAYLFYSGGVSVSVNNVDVKLQGPATIAAGDTVPLSLSVTNRNPAPLENATLEVDFPDGTRSAADVTQAYPRYTEDLGTLQSGEVVTRSIKAVVFGGAGQSLTLPISLSYSTAGSNSVFVKKTQYTLAISSTPLSISVDTLSEAISGEPITLSLTVRSNANVPLQNVVVQGSFPFGFQVAHSSLPLSGSSFLLGAMQPGDTKNITLTGTLTGQANEQRVFHFTVGTANAPTDQAPAISYMTQDANITLAAPFISAQLAINGVSADNPVIQPGSTQTVTLSYANTLSTSISNASVSVQVSGSAVDYNSVRTTSGFYQSATHTITFSRDTDASLANLAPGASGIGSFSFSTLPAGSAISSPQITFTISVAGTRIGQSNVPEQVSASQTQVVKVATAASLSAYALHAGGPFTNAGPVPPSAGAATTYAVLWKVVDPGSAIAGASVSAVLPSYVTFTGQTSGSGSVTYDSGSRTVTWTAGDLAQGASAQAAFQVSLTPSSSQKGTAPVLVGPSALSAYDRYAGVQISGAANPVTTETTKDVGYIPADSTVR